MLDQAASRAVLFGVHAYQHLPALDGVRHNVPTLRNLLTAKEAGGLAGEHCVAVPANSTPAVLLDAVQDAADHARGLLLVYYAGHGHFGRDGRTLLLGTEASRPDRPHHSVAYDEIRAIVAGSQARHRVVIVDCCFSGAALPMAGQEGDPTAADFDIEGACVLTSSAETERSLCLPDGSVFTRELTFLLRDGLSGELSEGRRGEHLAVLTMADVYEALRGRLSGRTLDGHRVPIPRMSTRDGGHRIPLATNQAHTPPAVPPSTESLEPPAPTVQVTVHTAYAATPYFTGRQDELEELERAARQPAAVCLVHGRGGQGKSELLRAAAARIAPSFPGGCLEVDLRGWTPDEQPRDPHMVIAEQLHHMGYGPDLIPEDLSARAETWRLFLKQHAVLLLLDNARDARQLAPLLPSAGSPSAVLISSRSELPELGVHWRCELPPLPAAHCVTVWHKMGVPQDTGSLDQIADRISGSPLALGPVGTSLLRGASPAAILASLAGPERYAAFPSLDAAERAAFTSAYNALDADLRNLIHQCAWHPGPDFAPDSLAAMAQRPEHEIEVRLAEIEQLLIRQRNRYGFHDSSLSYARQTAALHSAQDEEQASRHRLYRHLQIRLKQARDVLHVSARHNDQKVLNARQWLDGHAQELQAAARASSTDNWPQVADFLQAVGTSLYLDDRYIEAQELFQQILGTTSPTSFDHAGAFKGLGEIHRLQGRYEEATAAFQEALTIYQALGSRSGQAGAMQGLGEIHRLQGRDEEATAAYQEALAIFQALGDRLGQAYVTQGLGEIHQAQGRYEEATAAYQEALTIFQALGDRLGQAYVTQGLGEIHRLQDRYEEATAAYQEILAIFQALGDRLGQAGAMQGLGQIHQAQGRYEETTAAYQEALTIYQALGNRSGQAGAMLGLGEIHRLQGRDAEATAAFQEALTIYQALGDRSGQAGTMLGLGEIHQAQGRYEKTTAAFQAALTIYQALGDRSGQAGTMQGLGEIHRLQGRYEEATAAFQEALTIYQALGNRSGQADAKLGLGEIHRLQDRYEEGTAAYQEALTIYQALGNRSGQAGAMQGLGGIYRLQDRYEEGTAAFQEALAIFQALGDRLGQAYVAQGLGEIHQAQGRYEEATAAFQEALTIFQAFGDRPGQAYVAQGLGEIHQAQGRYEEATAAFQEALTVFQAFGDRLGQAYVTQGLGEIYRLQDRYEEATAAFQEALTIFQALGDRLGQAGAMQGLGQIHQAQGRYEEATAAFQEALTIYQALGNRSGQAGAMQGLGEIHRLQGRDAEATAAFQEALTIYQALGDRSGQAGAT
ncbi:caspase, EACC1-associated type [Streptomyces coeruleofuscus]